MMLLSGSSSVIWRCSPLRSNETHDNLQKAGRLTNSLTSSSLHRRWRSIKSPGESLRCLEGKERLLSFFLLVFTALAGQPLDSPRLPWAAHHQCVYCLAHILQNEIDDQAQDELGLHNPFPDHQRVWVHPPASRNQRRSETKIASTSDPAALQAADYKQELQAGASRCHRE